ncbi:MAG: cytochrome b5 domain-containing protein [Nakamurella sp.]
MAPQESTPGAALWAAERLNATSGHNNLGPLSTRHGFLPAPGSIAALPSSHTPWDELAAALPEMHRELTLRTAVDRMPMLPADSLALPDYALQRAAMILGLLAHGSFHLSPTGPAPPPPTITTPWAEVCRRLGRSGPYLSYLDLIVSNWRFRDPTAADPMRVGNLRLLIPTVDNEEEHIFYLTQTEILASTAPAVTAAVRIDDAIRRDDPDGVTAALDTITDALRSATRSSLPTISPRPNSRSYVDPVVWARTVAPFAVPIATGPLGPSGTASPIFNLLDSLFQRKRQRSQLGQEILGHRAAYPQNWRRFLTAVDAVGLGPFVERTNDPRLSGSLAAALEAYAGQTGFLSRHRRKVYGYLEIAFKVGRGVTIGGFAGAPKDRTWIQVDRELEKSQLERGVAAASAPAPVRPTPDVDDRWYPLSELVLHNDDDHGYWIGVDGGVYDISDFLRRHPGGPMVLAGYSGLDATQAYHRLHSNSTAAAAALRRCRIGRLMTPEWDSTVAAGTGWAGGADTRPARLFTTWAGLLCSVVEMQNALRQDYSLRRGVGLSRESEEAMSPYLLERNVDTYERFVTHHLRPINDAVTDQLWPTITAAFPDAAPAAWMRQQMDRIWTGDAAAAVATLPGGLRTRLTMAVSGDTAQQRAEFRRIQASCEHLAVTCAGFLGELKRLLQGGLLLLERWHSDQPTADAALTLGLGAELAAIAKQVPGLLACWLEQVAAPPSAARLLTVSNPA